jgi:flagellar assembly protein FliH
MNELLKRYPFTAFDAKPEPPAPPEPVPEMPVAPPAPVYGEADVENARRDGYQAGFEAGRDEEGNRLARAQTEQEEGLRILLSDMAERIQAAQEERRAYWKEQEHIMGKLVLTLARKVAGNALMAAPAAGLASLLEECADLIGGASRLVISVSPEIIERVGASVETLKLLLPAYGGEIVLREDPALGPHDCRVAWGMGEAEYNERKLWQALEALLPGMDQASTNH